MHKTYLAISLFVGMYIGYMFIGSLSDTRGRRFGSLVAAAVLSVFALASVMAPSYWSLCLLRLGVGVGIGCKPAVVTALSEVLPTPVRYACGLECVE